MRRERKHIMNRIEMVRGCDNCVRDPEKACCKFKCISYYDRELEHPKSFNEWAIRPSLKKKYIKFTNPTEPIDKKRVLFEKTFNGFESLIDFEDQMMGGLNAVDLDPEFTGKLTVKVTYEDEDF